MERRGEDVKHIPVFPMSTVEGLPKDIKTHKSNGYDVIVIDGVPQLDQVAVKTILLSDLLIIPITPSIDDLKSFQRFLKVYEQAKVFRDEIPAYLVLNKFNGRIGEDQEVREALAMFEEFGIGSIKSTIGDRVAHRRSSKYGLTAYEWEDPKAKKEVEDFGQEIEAIITSLLSQTN
jgi:chromosome partitioning protein